MKSNFDSEGCTRIVNEAFNKIEQTCQEFKNMCEESAQRLGSAGEAIGGDLGNRAYESYATNVEDPYNSKFKPQLDSFTNGAQQVINDYKTAFDEAAAALQAK